MGHFERKKGLFGTRAGQCYGWGELSWASVWGESCGPNPKPPRAAISTPMATGWTEHCRTLKHSPSSAMLLIVGAQMGNDFFCPLSEDRVVGDRNLLFHFGCLTKASSLSMSISWLTDWVELLK